MITNILIDFSRVLIFPRNKQYEGLLNDLYKKVIKSKSYNFLNEFEFNQNLLNFLKKLKNKYNLSVYTTDIIQNDLAAKSILKPIFANIFVANDLGISKKDSNGYYVIAKELNSRPEEILFIDDNLENIKAATKIGLHTILFSSNEQLVRELKIKLDI